MICMRRVCQREEHVHDGILGGWGVSRSSLRPNTPHRNIASFPSFTHSCAEEDVSLFYPFSSFYRLLFFISFFLTLSSLLCSWTDISQAAAQNYSQSVTQWVLKVGQITLLFSAHKVLMRLGGWVQSPLFHGTSFTGLTNNAWFPYQTITFLKCHSAVTGLNRITAEVKGRSHLELLST